MDDQSNDDHNLRSVNGKFEGTRVEAYEKALSMALKESLSLVKDNDLDNLELFMRFFVDKNLAEAHNLYVSFPEESRILIDSQLEKIPWRISCEYCQIKDKIKWINSWIKIGWWDPNIYESSPQLYEGIWFSENTNKIRKVIPTTCFKSVVWSGYGGKMIYDSICNGNRILVEFEHFDDFLRPVNIGSNPNKHLNPSHIYDLSFVTVGSIKPSTGNSLDIFRRHHSTTENSSTKLQFYQGSSLGQFLSPVSGEIETKHCSIDHEEDFELIYFESDDSEPCSN